MVAVCEKAVRLPHRGSAHRLWEIHAQSKQHRWVVQSTDFPDIRLKTFLEAVHVRITSAAQNRTNCPIDMLVRTNVGE